MKAYLGWVLHLVSAVYGYRVLTFPFTIYYFQLQRLINFLCFLQSYFLMYHTDSAPGGRWYFSAYIDLCLAIMNLPFSSAACSSNLINMVAFIVKQRDHAVDPSCNKAITPAYIILTYHNFFLPLTISVHVTIAFHSRLYERLVLCFGTVKCNI